MQDPARGRAATPVVNALFALNVIVFILWLVPAVPAPFMAEHFLISWQHLATGRVWTLVTAVFSHNMLFHLVINMIVLSSFGPPLELLMGRREFLLFYLIAGVIGSLAHASVSHYLIGRTAQPALGASSALAGVLLLFALTFPKARVLLFFILPLPAIVAALAFIGLDVWGLVAQVEGGGLPIGHGAHLGGALTGIVYFVVRGRALKRTRQRLAITSAATPMERDA
jgi:membrane associated rhomboid family serine protease